MMKIIEIGLIFFDKHIAVSDEKYINENTIIHTLAGMTMSEKNKICLS